MSHRNFAVRTGITCVEVGGMSVADGKLFRKT
jgi:hypothetical protein